MVPVNEMVLMVATSVGWVGAVGTVGAYALVSRSRLDANSMRFQTVNVVSAGLLAVSALSVTTGRRLVSNLVWAALGVHALSAPGTPCARPSSCGGGSLQERVTKPDSGAQPADEVALAA